MPVSLLLPSGLRGQEQVLRHQGVAARLCSPATAVAHLGISIVSASSRQVVLCLGIAGMLTISPVLVLVLLRDRNSLLADDQHLRLRRINRRTRRLDRCPRAIAHQLDGLLVS